jgi:hypothetical protein
VVVWAGDGGPGKLDHQLSLSMGPTKGKLPITHRNRSPFNLLYGLLALYTNCKAQDYGTLLQEAQAEDEVIDQHDPIAEGQPVQPSPRQWKLLVGR